ncbi:MAG: segregation/condensation protein A [Micrococcales bacterium]|nr:segregation/condensation protein A [Micrococcales bacterium]
MKGLIVGLANDQSLAWGCASALHNQGATLALTYLNDKARPHVEPLAQAVEAPIFLPLDVTRPEEVDALFDAVSREWGNLDFLLHSIAFAPKEIPHVGLDHLHAPLVSIREQAAVVVTMLRSSGSLNFRELIAGVDQPGIVVARFLSVLELYRHAALSFEQVEPLGELTLRWTAERWSDENLATLGADYDR